MALCASSQNISLAFLKIMKKNPLLFSSTLKPFIIQVLKKQLDEAS